MHFVGLPATLGLVWLTALFGSIYPAIVIYVELATSLSLTSAQATILCTLILIAHVLPIELKIVQKAGPKILFSILWRVGGALIFAKSLHLFLSVRHLLQDPSHIVWKARPVDLSWTGWLQVQLNNLIKVGLIIFFLVITLSILEKIGVISLIKKILAPALSIIGLSEEAAPLTLIGLLLGLAYGGSLMIKEIQSGRIGPRDILLSLAFLSLCHSLIEDTLILALIGGNIAIMVGARLVVSVGCVWALSRIISGWNDAKIKRVFWTSFTR